jgi:hypothetical protein
MMTQTGEIGRIYLAMTEQPFASSPYPSVPSVERRSKPRMACSFPTTLRERLPGGGHFDSHAVLSNISVNGMYMYTNHRLPPDELVFVRVCMFNTPLVATGKIVRIDPKVDGTYGVALKLLNYRYL